MRRLRKLRTWMKKRIVYSYQSQGGVEAEEDEESTDEQSSCKDDGLGAEDRQDAHDLDNDGKYNTL